MPLHIAQPRTSRLADRTQLDCDYAPYYHNPAGGYSPPLAYASGIASAGDVVKIFLSVAGVDRDRVEETAYALQGEGYDVFLDDHRLPAGEVYHRRIRTELFSSDLMVFFLSPSSLEAGRYTLTEIELAKERWGHAHGRVLPVELIPVDKKRVPPFLRAVSFCVPKGNVAAEVAHEIGKMAASLGKPKPAPSDHPIGTQGPGPSATDRSPFAGIIAALAFMVLAAVVSVLTHQLVGGLDWSSSAAVVLHGLTLTLLVWLAAMLFDVRGPAPYLTLAAGSFCVYIFDYAAQDILQWQPALLSTCKALVFVAVASLGVVSFRSWLCWLAFGLAGWLALQLILIEPSLRDFAWRSLVVGIAAYFLEANRASQSRGLTLLQNVGSWFAPDAKGDARRRRV